MSKRRFKFLLTVSAICLLGTSVRAQTSDQVVFETVQQLSRQAVARLNLACQEKETITSFKNGVMSSQNVYEGTVVSARLQPGGGLDRQSSYRELLRIDGRQLLAPRQVFNIPMEPGVSHVQSVFGPGYPILRFTLSNSSPGEPQGWMLTFQKKESATDPPGYRVPNFGRVWIDKESHYILRAELHDELPVTRFLNGTDTYSNVERAIVEDFIVVVIDGEPRWLTKTRNTHVVPKADRTLVYTSAIEYQDCRKFTTTVTIKPLP